VRLEQLPLNALRAFEAAARHLSFAKASEELRVTPGALSHQIRGLEDLLGVKLFERKVRAIALTAIGKLLYPGLQTGFGHIRDAVAGIGAAGPDNVLVVSTPPGFTAKWLAPRLYKFAQANPRLDIRISSGVTRANFISDGVDVAVRNLLLTHTPAPDLAVEKLATLALLPVCSPDVMSTLAGMPLATVMQQVPIIHDESLSGMVEVPGWSEWLAAAGLTDLTLDRGLHFNSADHALEAAIEGAGLLLAHALLAYDDLRTGRLVTPFGPRIATGRAYYFVCPVARRRTAKIEAFRTWIEQEFARMEPAEASALARRGRGSRRQSRPA
jgi:LysR family glycine cleavage system transcriptional activator